MRESFNTLNTAEPTISVSLAPIGGEGALRLT